MRIRDDGLVGINETSPTAQLQVKSGATNRIGLVVDTLSGQASNVAEFRVNTGNVLAVQTNGRLRTNNGIANLTSGSNSVVDTTTNGTVITRDVADTNPALITNLANASATGNIQVWQKAGVAKATITNGGGATFSGNVYVNANLKVDIENATLTNAFDVVDSTTSLMYVETSGDVYNQNGTYGTISDLRLKENIVKARDYTQDLMKLNVVKYSFKKDHSETPTHLGFIAQEVEQVFPGLVETKKTKELDDQKQIKTSVLIPMLVKAIQELNKRIEELEKK
jgi:hypothetical protein